MGFVTSSYIGAVQSSPGTLATCAAKYSGTLNRSAPPGRNSFDTPRPVAASAAEGAAAEGVAPGDPDNPPFTRSWNRLNKIHPATPNSTGNTISIITFAGIDRLIV